MKKKSEKKKLEAATLGFELAPQLRPVQKENVHATWGHRGHRGHKGHKGHRGHKGHKGHKGHRGHKGHKGHKGTQGTHPYKSQKSINSSEVLAPSPQICNRMHQ